MNSNKENYYCNDLKSGWVDKVGQDKEEPNDLQKSLSPK